MNLTRPPTAHDRHADSVANIVLLEHVNCVVDDQRLATLFYVSALGGTRDPFLFTGLDNMWVNFGRTQVHLPSRGQPAQRLRGRVGFVVPDLPALAARLDGVRREMARVLPERQSRFDFEVHATHVDLVCPWGTPVRCHAPAPEFGAMQLGLAYIDFPVPADTADGIARFYAQALGARSHSDGRQACIVAGPGQSLRFTETDAPLADYDGHHFLVYLADFGRPYDWLRQRGLITRDQDPHEWRFEWIVDPEDGRQLFQVEHEVRSLRHPLFARPLVNRDAQLTVAGYSPGAERFRGKV